MAKLNITFNGVAYSIEESVLAEASTKFQAALVELVELGKPKYSEGLQYSLNADSASYSVTQKGSCKDADIIIPAEYEGLPVTKISDGAFIDHPEITSVVIPDSVTSIGRGAFADCTSLTNIIFTGTTTQWSGVGKDMYWNTSVLATYVQCSDGQVEFTQE